MEDLKTFSLDFWVEEQAQSEQIPNDFHVTSDENLQRKQFLVAEDGTDEEQKSTRRPETIQHSDHIDVKASEDKAKRKGSHTCETGEDEPLNINTCHGPDRALEPKKATPVAFLIPVGLARACRPPPKRFCNPEKTDRENLSIERIRAKQEMAERRKKQHEERRLKRIHDRQEAARKLAQNVEILLYQRSLAGVDKNTKLHASKMSSAELMATAHHVAKDFKTLTSQTSKDLTVDEKNNNVPRKWPSQVKHVKQKGPNCGHAKKFQHAQNTNNSIAFTVGFDEEIKTKSPVPKMSGTHNKERSKLTATHLEEKQRQAEERRLKRQQERVQRVVANREALLKLASDLEAFMTWHNTERSGSTDCGDSDKVLDRQEAAKLANKIADGFDKMSQRYTRDLQRAEGFQTCTWWSQKPLPK